MTGLLVPVVVEGWQYECCGVAPAVGQRVAWRLVLRDEDWPAAAVDLPVAVVPLAPELAQEWRDLGNDPGPDPSVARADGLVVLVRDASAIVGDRLCGLLQEDHHVAVPTGLEATSGVVERVWLVSRRLRHQGARRVVRIPRTEELVEVAAAPDFLPYEPPPEGALTWRETSDVLVDLRVDAPAPRSVAGPAAVDTVVERGQPGLSCSIRATRRPTAAGLSVARGPWRHLVARIEQRANPYACDTCGG